MVDLEQFREAVKCWRRSAAACGSSDDVKEADRLLSIIDNAGKVASAEPVAWITPESIRHLAKMNGPANVVVWNCASGNARVPLYAAPHQPAPVGDDAARLLAICQNAHDRLLRGDDDSELLAILEQAWSAREAVA